MAQLIKIGVREVLYLHPDEYVIATNLLRSCEKRRPGDNVLIGFDTDKWMKGLIEIIGEEQTAAFMEAVARNPRGVDIKAHDYIPRSK